MSFEADTEEGSGGGAGAGSSAGRGTQQRLSFAAAGSAVPAGPVVETSGVGRHAFFRIRKLQRVGEVF
jgi:ribonuclease H2 subunit A